MVTVNAETLTANDAVEALSAAETMEKMPDPRRY